MITNLDYKNLRPLNDLKELGEGRYLATGEDPYLEIKNLPKDLIQDITIELESQAGQIIEIYWTHSRTQSYSPSLRSSQKLISGAMNTYRFLIDAEKGIKKLRIDPTNATGSIVIKNIGIFHLTSKEKEKLTTVPPYKNIPKITLKGKSGFLFLINDSNHELRQHFDLSYHNNFDPELFIKNLNFKKKYCTQRHIQYHFFITPDKSLVCKDFLPFEVRGVKRNYDSIKELVPDFINRVDPNCYFKNDSHINYSGGKILSYCYLNQVDTNLKESEFNQVLDGQISVVDGFHDGDLTYEKNWSYPEEEKKRYLKESTITYRNDLLQDKSDVLPEEFKYVGIRETKYYLNPKGFTNLKVLIFSDSSFDFLKDVLSTYFKEILFYWDHWFFNKELIDWYKPDIIFEIRTERFLENMKYEIR